MILSKTKNCIFISSILLIFAGFAAAQEAELIALEAKTDLLLARGYYALAAQSAKKALDRTKEIYGVQHANTATAYSNLAYIFVRQGKYRQAETLLIHAVRIWQQTVGNLDRNVAIALNNLGELYKIQGDDHAAEFFYRKALKIKLDIYGPDDLNTAITLHNLGELLVKMEKYEGAKNLFEYALKILEHAPSRDSKKLFTTLANLADLYELLGDETASLTYRERSLEVLKN